MSNRGDKLIKAARCSRRERHLAARRKLVAGDALVLIVLGAITQTTFSEGLPDLTPVGSLGERLVCVENGITGLDEVGVAGLPLSLLARALGRIEQKTEGKTYRAIPSMTSFMARYFPSVGTPPFMVGLAETFLPCLSIRFHISSYSMVAQTVPMECTESSPSTLE